MKTEQQVKEMMKACKASFEKALEIPDEQGHVTFHNLVKGHYKTQMHILRWVLK